MGWNLNDSTTSLLPNISLQNDCTPPKCGELSEYTNSAHTEVEDLSSRYMNGSNVYDQCGFTIYQLQCKMFSKSLTNVDNVPVRIVSVAVIIWISRWWWASVGVIIVRVITVI